jgi:hypothetical protein
MINFKSYYSSNKLLFIYKTFPNNKIIKPVLQFFNKEQKIIYHLNGLV